MRYYYSSSIRNTLFIYLLIYLLIYYVILYYIIFYFNDSKSANVLPSKREWIKIFLMHTLNL